MGYSLSAGGQPQAHVYFPIDTERAFEYAEGSGAFLFATLMVIRLTRRTHANCEY